MNTTTKQPKLTGAEQVAGFLKTLEHPLKDVVTAVREIILSANSAITEHIKWNAPSFCFSGEDRITMNLRSNDFLLLVFHRGAKVKTDVVKIDDPQNLVTWLSADRATVKFSNIDDVNFKKGAILDVVNSWIKIA